jgi:glutamate formiminotransferase/formiminotetrahydrofolate cyclodeaminase
MHTASEAFALNEAMAQKGNPASVSDAGVGALATKAAIHGAYLNVLINCADYSNQDYTERVLAEASELLDAAGRHETRILSQVMAVIKG